MAGFQSSISQVRDRVLIARDDWFDVNLTVVVGREGTVLVDTGASSTAITPLLEQWTDRSLPPVVAVVNTHAHFDHVLGNQAVLEAFPEALVWAHEDADLVGVHDEARAWFAAHPDDRRGEVFSTPVRLPDRTVSSVAVLDLGDRVVELLHPGPGHTGGDLVVHVPDADLLVLGDLVEESAPPAWGPDSHPLAWPASLDLVLGLMGPDTLAVPGHGAPVSRDFVSTQQGQIAAVAQQVADLAAAGVGPGEMLETGSWPYPVELLHDAVARAWQQLPRGSKRLPLA